MIKGNPIEMEFLSGKKIAIDAFNTIFQFLSIIRDRQTGQPLMDSKGCVTSHLSGLLYRTANFLQAGIKPIYVFDGKPPAFKLAVSKERREIREAAHAKWQAALEAGEAKEEILKAAKMSSRLTSEMLDQSKDLLSYMGVPWVQAPSEGEAQCAMMCRQKIVYASASQDWDSLLFGSTRLVRNLSVSGRRKIPRKENYVEIKPELLEINPVLEQLGLTREQLIVMAMLMGTDFNPGVQGYGPKKALKLVKEEKTLKRILEKIEWIGPPPEEVFELFMNPPSVETSPEFKPPQPQKIIKMMVDEHEFSQERVDKVLKTLEEAQPKSGGLGKWVK